jgi:ribose-phosphate pyrophosphokinase
LYLTIFVFKWKLKEFAQALIKQTIFINFVPLIKVSMSIEVKIFAGRASKHLGEQIAKSYGIAPGKVIVSEFSDGEFQPSFEETVRGQDVFIVQSTMPPADNLMELLLLIDAAKS